MEVSAVCKGGKSTEERLPDFLPISALADLLSYSPRSVWRWGKRENVRFVKLGNRTGMWRRDYERWLNWRRDPRNN